MAKITGQLQDIYEKSFGNGGTAAYIKVNNVEYKFGKFKPRGFEAGDWVEFEAVSKQNGQYTNWAADYKTLRKSDPSAGGNSNPAPMDKPAAPRSGGFAGGNDDRQETISRQAAFNTALTFTKILVDAGAIGLPAKVKKEGAVEFYTELVDTLATDFYHKSTGKTWKIEKAKPVADEFSDEVPDLSEDDPSW